MYALVVKKRLDLFGNPHVVVQAETSDVGRGCDTVAGELPDVKLMYVTHTFNLSTAVQCCMTMDCSKRGNINIVSE